MIDASYVCGVAVAFLLTALLMWVFTADPCRKRHARRCRDGGPHEWGQWALHGHTYNQRTCKKCNYTMTE